MNLYLTLDQYNENNVYFNDIYTKVNNPVLYKQKYDDIETGQSRVASNTMDYNIENEIEHEYDIENDIENKIENKKVKQQLYTNKKLIYSIDNISLNNINLKIKLEEVLLDNVKCIFSIIKNKNIINKIEYIEKSLLKKINTDKIPQYNIFKQFNEGIIKFTKNNELSASNSTNYSSYHNSLHNINDNIEIINLCRIENKPSHQSSSNKITPKLLSSLNIILRIIGIWINNTDYGIIFRIYTL